MDPDASNHSFIVKIWLEEFEAGTGRPLWRGYVTHVPSGRRRYIRHLYEILEFIQFYLSQMGVREQRLARLYAWLRHLVHD